MPDVWLEKTIVKGRKYKEEGEYSLGRALWSPQTDKRGADIYAFMREVKPGDIILHLINDKEIFGVSVAASDVDKDFKHSHTPGKKWSTPGKGDSPGYMIRLRNFVKLDQPVNRDELLKNDLYKSQLQKIRSDHKVFYRSDLNLNQGAYLTEVPMDLLGIVNDVYRDKTGEDLPYVDACLRSSEVSSNSSRVSRASDLLLSKKQVVFYGPPGTGKTYEAQRFAASFLSGDLKNNARLKSKNRKLGELEGEIVAMLTANSWVDHESSKTLASKYGCSIQTVAALKAHIYKQRILGKSWRSKK